MMKKIFIILFMAVTALPAIRVAAQSTVIRNDIAVDNVRIVKSDGQVCIDMNIVLRGVRLGSAAGLDIIPVLITPDREFALPRIALKGPAEYRAYERRQVLTNDRRNVPYVVEKGRIWSGRIIEYNHTFDFEPWMDGVTVELVQVEVGCGTTGASYAEYLGKIAPPDETPLVPLYVASPQLAYIQPVAGEVKHREKEAEVFLDFVVNKYDIRPEFMNNPRELAKIYEILDELKNDPDISVKRMDIIGFASPEGSLQHNKWLSERRATALRDYLFSQYDFPRNIYHIVFGGENWDGLVEALETTNVPYKSEVLAIIENYSIENNRESRLMSLRSGDPYRYMLNNIFPRLRVARCRIEYDIRDFTVAEACELIGKEPQKLSLNEMFLVARTHDEGSNGFDEVFETAVRMYPNNQIAILNAAAAALKRNDLVSAERYLTRIGQPAYPAEYYNSMGVLAMLRGDYATAQDYLTKSVSLGLEAAHHNLSELEKKKTSN